jgi:MFS transporter, DHA1 family, multidrug resistance protein
MVVDLIREAPLGQLIRYLSKNTLLRYPEEEPNFELPVTWAVLLQNNEAELRGTSPSEGSESHSGHEDLAVRPRSGYNDDPALAELGKMNTASTTRTAPFTSERMQAERTHEMERTQTLPIVPQRTADNQILVDWYTTDDPANPQNWSTWKKNSVVFMLCFYTFTVYCAGPIYAASVPGLEEHFGISPVAASLGLGLYVLAYGIGDLLFSPLTEIPAIGRNPVYYLTFIVFWVLSFPTATVDSFGGLLALRFWLGFFGSPALANGGATIGDMFTLIHIPYGLCWWVFSAWAGPALGPVIGGFAAMAKGWRWPM